MRSTSSPFRCTTCEDEIRLRPVFHLGLPFCCAGCVASGPCTCTYDPESSDLPAVRHCLDVAEPGDRVPGTPSPLAPRPAALVP